MKLGLRGLPFVLVAVLAMVLASIAIPAFASQAARAGASASPPTTISVDDAQQGTGLDQFDYVGDGWGHASGEGAPANPYDGTNSWTDETGDSVTFSFTGTNITFYTVTDPSNGLGSLSLDGGTPVTLDFYGATRTGDVALWTSPTLTNGKHTITVTNLGQKDAASTGDNIIVDRVAYIGQPAPPVHTAITVDPASAGRIFDGIGAISGGGGNSRLLIDYPAKQRNQILDYLFKPGYGASLQVLKLEIGGGANSTDGSEPSIEDTKGKVDCNVGYEFWLAEQAKRLNPNIKLYGLAWTAPGWIGNGNFWSQDMINYLMTWIGCAKSDGLTINYLGGWNERGYNATWYENLHAAIVARHLPTEIVADDSGWDEADAMATDPAFANAVSILGAHYSCEGGDGGNADSCSTTQNALNTGKPLWDSEQGSQDDNSGAPALIRAITRGYIDAQMTALLNWPLIASMTSNLPYPTDGMMVADSPWSGNYSVGENAWVTAQVTQFTQPGWQFLNTGSGYLGGNRNNGSYISLASPAKTDYSTIVETTTATAAQTATFTVPKALAGKTVHVWATNLGSTSSANYFVHLGNVTPSSSGTFNYTLQPDYVYTFSTVNSAGHGNATGPASHSLALPYSDNYNEYAAGQEARYTEDMQGTFEAQPCVAGRGGMCLQQMLPIKPIEWQQDSDAFTLIGDPSWTNYSAKVDVELTKPGTVELIGRAGTQNRPQSDQQGYYFQISNTGSWTLLKSDDNGNRTVLATASVPALGIHKWHQLGLSFSGSAITASVDGKAVVVVTDSSYTAGQVGVGITSYATDQFDNLSVTPTKSAAATPTVTVTPSVKTVQMGKDVSVTATFSVPKTASAAEGVNLTLNTPSGFYIDPNGQGQNQLDGLALAQVAPMAQVYGVVKPGQHVTATWQLTAPVDAASAATLSATATFAQKQVAHVLTGSGSLQVVDPPAPTGAVDVSSLSFLSSTNGLPNGWGPVERNESVGGSNANDGQPITIDGTVYPQGLGTNSVSDVKVYLGGNCSTFTSTVGVDDEVGNSGSVTFSVLGDGQTLASTKVINGGDPAQTVTANVTGVQVLDLVVGDGAPPGNGNDHGDWAMPTLTCSS
jgi:hypothetical protein